MTIDFANIRWLIDTEDNDGDVWTVAYRLGQSGEKP